MHNPPVLIAVGARTGFPVPPGNPESMCAADRREGSIAYRGL